VSLFTSGQRNEEIIAKGKGKKKRFNDTGMIALGTGQGLLLVY